MSIIKTVYFVRHGQSEHNVAPVFQSPDSPLSEEGRGQALSMAERVAKISFDVLISSPFVRAKETAEAIAQASGKTIEISELFTERIKPSYINGKPYTDSKAELLWRQWEESLLTPGARVEDGENYDDLLARAEAALSFLENRPEQNFVVVTHGYFLRFLVAKVLLGEHLSADIYRRFQTSLATENTGLTVLRLKDDFEQKARWRLWIYNDHAHLG